VQIKKDEVIIFDSRLVHQSSLHTSNVEPRIVYTFMMGVNGYRPLKIDAEICDFDWEKI